MLTTSMDRPIGQDSTPQHFQNLQQGKDKKSFEKLKAFGYGSLALVTAIALSTLAMLVAMLTAGAFWGAVGVGAGMEGMGALSTWLGYTLISSFAIGPALAYFPIVKIAAPIFANAKAHWNQG